MPHVIAQDGDQAGLLVLLPGLRDRPQDFIDRAFADPVPPGWRVVAADAHLGYYRNRSLPTRLDADVIGLQSIQDPLIIAGISLGGMGSVLHYCETRDRRIQSLILLSPFLGDQEIIEHVSSYQRPAQWRADPEIGREFEHRLWRCLIDTPWNSDSAPELWLGFGYDDDLRPGHEIVAGLLDSEHVLAVEGGHDWPTWQRLWTELAPKALGL